MRGIAALITVISLGSLVFVISLSTAIVTFWSIKNIDANKKGMITYYAAYSGIQDALVKLERNKDFSGEYYLSINDIDNVTVIVSNTGDSVTIYSEAVSGQIYKRIETTADIDSTTGLIVPVQTKEVIISDVTTAASTTTTTTTTTLPLLPRGDDVNFTYKGSKVTYGTVEHNECWMDRNLGASIVAQSYNDSDAYGDLFQWGRLDDGHQNRDSGTTTNLSSTDDPGHSNFIVPSSYPYDWRSPQNDNLWQGVSGTNNPCPSGWRIPTKVEWDNERLNWSSQDSDGAYASPLKLTVAGARNWYDTSLFTVGSTGYYWSDTAESDYMWRLGFESNYSSMYNDHRAYGFSVRCIKD